MKKSNRCMPIGDLPYTNEKATTRMMVKLFEDIPYLANLPKLSESENILNRTLSNIPGIRLKEGKIYIRKESEALKSQLAHIDVVYNTPTSEDLKEYAIEAEFLNKYFQIIERIKPNETLVNFYGPFSLMHLFHEQEPSLLLADKYYRKLLVQIIALKAMWVIDRIKSISPETTPIIMLEEPLLHKIGWVKRENEEITVDLIVNFLAKLISKLHDSGAKVAIQCFEKCDWKVPIQAGVDIISFDAYNNPNNLNIMAEEVNEFLAKGGKINWAIVPTKNETMIKGLSADLIFDRLAKTFEGLIIAGASEKLVYNRALVSIQGSVSELPLLFAEKALMVSNQVAKRIPLKS